MRYFISPFRMLLMLLTFTFLCIGVTNTMAAKASGVVNTRPLRIDVQFESGSSSLGDKTRSRLDTFIQEYKMGKYAQVDVSGHADESENGGDQGHTLGGQRVQAVKEYLGTNGISSGLIQTSSYGSTQPKYDPSTEEGRKLNRRVEIGADGPPVYINESKSDKTLSDAAKAQLLRCFGEIPADRSWLRDVFFYHDGMKCLSFNTYRDVSYVFYNLSLLEELSGLPLDTRPDSTIVAEDNYSSGAQLLLNPAFVKWLDVNFTQLQEKNPPLHAFAQKVYGSQKEIARSFVFAYEYLTKYDDYQKQIQLYKKEAEASEYPDMLSFLKQFRPDPQQGYDKVANDYDDEGYTGFEDGINRFRFAVGFWLRRGIDGTASDFKSLLASLMQEYDADWFAKHPI